jgi:hypothetical protein
VKNGATRRQRRVNERLRAAGPAQPRSSGAPPWGRRRDEGDPVLDLLYAGVVIAVFAVLVLAVRGLDRL